MQINAASYPVTVINTTPKNGVTPPSSSTQTGEDTVVLKFPANSFTQLVEEAKKFPEVRADKVAEFKLKVQSSFYPAPEIIDGMTALIGGALNPAPDKTGPSSRTPSSPA